MRTAGWIPRASSRSSRQRALHLELGLVEQRPRLGRRRPRSTCSSCSAMPMPEQPLLRAVVEVPLEPPALLVSRAHDARARLAQLRSCARSSACSCSFSSASARRRPDRLEQRWLIEEHGIVDHRRQLFADECHRTVGPREARAHVRPRPPRRRAPEARAPARASDRRRPRQRSRTPPGSARSSSTTRSPTDAARPPHDEPGRQRCQRCGQSPVVCSQESGASAAESIGQQRVAEIHDVHVMNVRREDDRSDRTPCARLACA